MSEPKIQPENPWDLYPRPQLRRGSFFSLNGQWTLEISNEEPQEITVPFCIESKLSGVGKSVRTGAAICYKKTFTLPKGFIKGRVLLHFGAVDQIARIVLNNHFYGSHEGGYTAFTVDITEAVKRDEENSLLVFKGSVTLCPLKKQEHIRIPAHG